MYALLACARCVLLRVGRGGAGSTIPGAMNAVVFDGIRIGWESMGLGFFEQLRFSLFLFGCAVALFVFGFVFDKFA